MLKFAKNHSTRDAMSMYGKKQLHPKQYQYAMLPEDLLVFLNDQIPCRQAQIKQLASLLDV